jgi:hypothetical protein
MVSSVIEMIQMIRGDTDDQPDTTYQELKISSRQTDGGREYYNPTQESLDSEFRYGSSYFDCSYLERDVQ